MTVVLIQLFNGVSFGMLLFLLAAGLSLIYGVMRILNLAHGSYYLLGDYVALSVVQATGSLALATLAGTAAVTALGVLMERVFLRRLPRGEELPQALLTFGFLLIFGDLALWLWGGTPQALPRPEALSRSLRVGALFFPSYRLFVIVVGAVMGLALWGLQEKTRLGGVIGGPLLGVYPGADFEILLQAFVVVIIGGLGSLKGAFFGALLVGLLDTFGKTLFPEFALFTIFAPMALILAVRPTGLFGA